MPVVSGYGLTNLSGTISLNLDKSQSRLQTEVSRLSSGLRINTAADDPSGLAIAEGLQSKVNGYDQASSNVQTATNALTVADGALQTVTDLLQRLRVLTVQANDDILSADDRGNIQTESTQLQAEINTIAENTTFNGIHLLNRTAYVPPTAPTIPDNTFNSPTVGTESGGITGSAWTFSASSASSGPGIANVGWLEANRNSQAPPSGSTQVAFLVDGASGTYNPGASPPSISQSISGFTVGASYAVTFNLAQDSGNTADSAQQIIAISVGGTQIGSYQPTPINPANPNWTTVTTPAFVAGSGSQNISFQGLGDGFAYIDNVQLSVISGAADVQGSDISIHDGADEGDALAVQLPTVFTSNLAISDDTVSDSTSAATYEGHIDSALDAVDTARATLGAEMVRLQYQAENDDTAAVNLTGSESNIRDLDIAATTTAFAQDQILTSIGTSVLASIKTQASLVEKLFQ